MHQDEPLDIRDFYSKRNERSNEENDEDYFYNIIEDLKLKKKEKDNCNIGKKQNHKNKNKNIVYVAKKQSQEQEINEKKEYFLEDFRLCKFYHLRIHLYDLIF